MAFTVKATAIVPKPMNVGKLKREIEYVLEYEGVNDRAILNKTISGWDGSKPTMGYKTGVTANTAWVWIGPDGGDIEKWVRIDEGTPERDIISATTMVFPFQGRGKSYNPKTRPLWLGSQSGAGQKFGPIRRTKHVKAHSIEPRYWSKTLAAQRIGPFAENVQAAIARGLA